MYYCDDNHSLLLETVATDAVRGVNRFRKGLREQMGGVVRKSDEGGYFVYKCVQIRRSGGFVKSEQKIESA